MHVVYQTKLRKAVTPTIRHATEVNLVSYTVLKIVLQAQLIIFCITGKALFCCLSYKSTSCLHCWGFSSVNSSSLGWFIYLFSSLEQGQIKEKKLIFTVAVLTLNIKVKTFTALQKISLITNIRYFLWELSILCFPFSLTASRKNSALLIYKHRSNKKPHISVNEMRRSNEMSSNT
jgi:hypothetical protein